MDHSHDHQLTYGGNGISDPEDLPSAHAPSGKSTGRGSTLRSGRVSVGRPALDPEKGFSSTLPLPPLLRFSLGSVATHYSISWDCD